MLAARKFSVSRSAVELRPSPGWPFRFAHDRRCCLNAPPLPSVAPGHFRRPVIRHYLSLPFR